MNDRSGISDGKPSICFVSPNNYAVLSGRSDLGHIGGSEIQQPMIARELLKRGYPVSFITLDHGQPDGIEHDGIRVYKMCSRSDGIPIVRFIHPRWTSLWRAMTRADADIYYQMNAGSETGQVAIWCQRCRRKFVFVAASVTDCDVKLPYLPTWRERFLYRHGLRLAARVIAQTRVQVIGFRQAFGIETIMIRSCSLDPGSDSKSDDHLTECTPPRLLWVGRFAEEKRPELLLDLAANCREFEFVIVGAGNDDCPRAARLRACAEQLANVTLVGRVPHAEIGRYYAQATLLLCTSAWEGYPNTFMEAWAHSVPTVSTVDPDDVISTNGLGGVGGTATELGRVIRRLTSSPQYYLDCSRRARRYFVDNHLVEVTANAYEEVIRGLCVDYDERGAISVDPPSRMG